MEVRWWRLWCGCQHSCTCQWCGALYLQTLVLNPVSSPLSLDSRSDTCLGTRHGIHEPPGTWHFLLFFSLGSDTHIWITLSWIVKSLLLLVVTALDNTNLYNNWSFLKVIHSWAVHHASNLPGLDIWLTKWLAVNSSNSYSIIDVINLLAQVNT